MANATCIPKATTKDNPQTAKIRLPRRNNLNLVKLSGPLENKESLLGNEDNIP